MSERKRTQSRRKPRRRAARRSKRPSGFESSQGLMQSSVTQSGFSVRSKPLFGYKARKNLQYYTTGTITSGASAAGTYVFAANGLYDTDITGSGGQPMGFDQMMIFFNHYTVLSTRIRVVFMTNSTNLRVSCGLSVNGSSTAITNYEQLIENGDITFSVLEYAGAFGGTTTMKRQINHGAFQGLVNTIDDPDMRGDSASNPAEIVYCHLSVWNPASATVVTADFQVLLEYDVLFHEPKKATLS